MKRLALIAILLLPALATAQRHREQRSWRVEDNEKIDRSFSFSGGDPHKLLVDNLSGFVHVTGLPPSTTMKVLDRPSVTWATLMDTTSVRPNMPANEPAG